MKEDDITKRIIKIQKESDFFKTVKIKPEAPYNYYGSRGFVDLFVIKEDSENTYHYIYEIKSKLNNANEVIRQLNKHRKYFYKEKGRHKPRGKYAVRWTLSILASEHNYNHVLDYFNMYYPIHLNSWTIRFRHPEFEGGAPISYGTESKLGEKEWVKTTQRNFPGLLSYLGVT